MVIRILQSSVSFQGVHYNETRVKKGEAELLCTRNFGVMTDFLSPRETLKLWSSRNSRIKNSQFHVVISAKGSDMSPEDLMKVGEEYLKEMGYGENPYLIYFHKNTDNNHIHIVTSRVDKNGHKINDSFEKERSHKFIIEHGYGYSANSLRSKINALLHYSYSTNRQFIELCKDAGYNVRVQDDKYIVKNGNEVVSVSKGLVDFCSLRYKKNLTDSKRKQIQARIFKYAEKLKRDEFVSYMKKNFGLSFIFYEKDNQLKAFSIIDYKNKAVYKGSEILSVKSIDKLLSQPKSPADSINLLLSDLLKSQKFATSNDVNKILQTKNLFYSDGVVVDKNTGVIYCEIAKKIEYRLFYNDRLSQVIEMFSPKTDAEIKFLSRYFKLKDEDIRMSSEHVSPSGKTDYYKQLLSHILDSDIPVRDELRTLGLDLYILGDDFVIFDKDNNVCVSGLSMDIGLDRINDNLGRNADVFEGINDRESTDIDLLGEDFFDALFVTGGGVGSSKPKKRRNN